MTSSTSGQALAPVSPGRRIAILDILRGIALLGVAVANVWLWFSGVAFLFPEYHAEVARLTLDAVVFNGIALLVSGKAATTFAFLFGLGFALQMIRAQEKGLEGVSVYRRRLLILLLIGLAHGFLLWYGDILAAYAALGFVLILFRNRSDRTVLAWAVVFLAVIPLAASALPLVMSAWGEGTAPPDAREEMAEFMASTLAAFQGGSYQEIVAANAGMMRFMYLSPKALWLFLVMGTFLLGLWAGRRRFFENVEDHRRGLRRLAAWGIGVGLVGSSATVALRVQVPPEEFAARPDLLLLGSVLYTVGTFPLAFGYIAAATLLARRAWWRKVLGSFAPVGRMALTNYLMQSVLFIWIFYGFGAGLIGRVGPAAALGLTLLAFGLQMIWSPLWLSRFRFGPAEWAWRSITYRKLQPMRVAPDVAAPGPPGPPAGAGAGLGPPHS